MGYFHLAFVIFFEGFLLLGGLLSTNKLIQTACFLLLPLPVVIYLHLIRQVHVEAQIMIKPILNRGYEIRTYSDQTDDCIFIEYYRLGW